MRLQGRRLSNQEASFRPERPEAPALRDRRVAHPCGHHGRSWVSRGNNWCHLDRAGNAMTVDDVKAAIFHDTMARELREASRYPWFLVIPYPPELEGPE